MGPIWRLSVVVIVLTLSPMQAWSECAWVLWHGIINPVDGELSWGPSGAYPAGRGQSECEEAAQAMMKRDERDSARKDARAMLRSAFVCLPDTVDPRGPKGGAR